MKIRVNGEWEEIAEATVIAVLEKRRLSTENPWFAVAINRTFVPRSEYLSRRLAEGDEVEIVTPRQGG